MEEVAAVPAVSRRGGALAHALTSPPSSTPETTTSPPSAPAQPHKPAVSAPGDLYTSSSAGSLCSNLPPEMRPAAVAAAAPPPAAAPAAAAGPAAAPAAAASLNHERGVAEEAFSWLRRNSRTAFPPPQLANDDDADRPHPTTRAGQRRAGASRSSRAAAEFSGGGDGGGGGSGSEVTRQQQMAEARVVPRVAVASKGPRAPPKPIHELLDELESGSPPPPRHIWESLAQWRKGRRGEPGGTAVELTARLDRLLVPRLQGEYGKEMPTKTQVFLLWSIVKAGLVGEAAMTLVRLLEESVRYDMPYSKDEFWASLAFYSIGLAQQEAGGGGGGAGGAADGGGRRSGPAAAAAAALVERARGRLVPELLGLLGRNARTINMQALSNTFWAAGLLQLRDHSALSALAEQAAHRAPEAQSQNIANILYGCAVLGLSDKEWAAVQGRNPFLERLISVAVRRRLVGFQPLEVSCVAWAACKLPGIRPKPLLEVVSEFVGRGGFDGVTSSQVWANTLYAMGLADFYDPRVFEQLARTLLLHGPQDNHNHHNHHDPQRKSGGGAASGRVQSAVHPPPLLRSATAQTCCNILFAMGIVRHLDERVVDVLLSRMVAVVNAAGSRAAVVDVALAVRACAQLNYRSPGVDALLDAALPAMKAQAPKLMAYNVLWSLMTLDMLDESRHQPLVRHLVYCINKYGTSTWKTPSAAPPSAAPPTVAAAALAASAAASRSGPDGTAYDDLTQLVQYHLESRYLGLTGPQYDLTPPYGIDAVVRQIRERRQFLAAQSSTVVHRKVVTMLEDMASEDDGRLPSNPRIRILSVDSEFMVEPELVVVDVLLTLEVRQDPDLPDPDLGRRPEGGGGGEPHAGARVCRLALEVDGPHHFMRNRPMVQDGASAYRDRVLLRRLDGLAVVPTSVWVERLRDDGERRRYLEERLAEAATEATEATSTRREAPSP
ncbi:hypothetical protein PLESTF_000461500 [Pleodorina starrii]|nr:hypothetical protein PLESTF_000461500 [Pleodorina starrii]